MNLRIKEFSKQSGIDIYGLGKDRAKWEAAMEKFTELIVQECADICDKIYFENYPDAEDYERSEEGDAIKQHFGVEE